MKRRNLSKIFALAMAGVMAFGNTAVYAGEANGAGIVEYDNSEAVAYDVIEVPTIADSTYDFTLDPTSQLHKYMPSEYGEGTVYFTSIGTRASIEGKTGVTLYTQSKVEVEYDEDSTVWSDIVATVEDDEIATVNAGYFVWVPDTANATAQTGAYAKGLPGKFVEITKDNIGNWLELNGDAGNKKIALKDTFKVAPNVCDGKVYQLAYTAVTGNKITDSDVDPLSNYVTIEDDEISEFINLYTDDEGTAATADDVTYTAEEPVNQGITDTVTVINKSTKAKTVTAVVTMSNVTGITFNETSTFANDDTDASMYIAATNGTITKALAASANGATASATYTVDLAAPTIEEITYMKAENDKNAATGGHNYARYEANGTVYGSDSFYITAAANTEGADAWDEWAKTVTAETRPEINIVYTVADKVDGSVEETPEIEEVEGVVVVADGVFYVGSSASAGFDLTDVEVTSVKVNGKALDVETQIVVTTNDTGSWIGAPAASIAAVEEDNNWAAGTEWTFEVMFGNYKYTASYTQS
jgi:hypothetical protein